MANSSEDIFNAYINGFDSEVQSRLTQLRKSILEAVPDVVEAFSYGMPKYSVAKKAIWFGAHKKHIGMYPIYGTGDMLMEMAPFQSKTAKHTLQFPHNKPIPFELIAKWVQYKLTINA